MGHLGIKNAHISGCAQKFSFLKKIKNCLMKRVKRFSLFFIYLQSSFDQLSFYYEKNFFGFKDKYLS